MRGEWRCASTRSGAPCVTTIGTTRLPKLCAGSWDSIAAVSNVRSLVSYISALFTVYAYDYICTCAHMYTHIYAHAHVCTFTHTCTHCTHSQRAHLHALAYMHAHTLTTRTCAYAHKPDPSGSGRIGKPVWRGKRAGAFKQRSLQRNRSEPL